MSSDDLGPKLPGAGYTLPDLVGDLADETASVIEVSGAIKWFDVSKGYGFIIPDNGMADVLLHVTCLRRGGLQGAHEGARGPVGGVQRPPGGQALPGFSVGETTPIQSSRSAAPRTPGPRGPAVLLSAIASRRRPLYLDGGCPPKETCGCATGCNGLSFLLARSPWPFSARRALFPRLSSSRLRSSARAGCIPSGWRWRQLRRSKPRA